MKEGDSEGKKIYEIGYCLGYDHWGNGYTAEAVKALIKYLFEEKGADTVFAAHHIDNEKSGRVMEKCGLTFVGERGYFFRNKNADLPSKIYKLDKEDFFR